MSTLYPIITYYGNSVIPGSTRVYGQVRVSVIDGATGLPANGNNMVVTVNQVINGVQTFPVVTVPGLWTPVYTGELSDTSSSSPFTSSFSIQSFVLGTGPTPNPAVCDLTIVANTSTPETAIGANDGTLKIIATSSYGPIQYSIDNVNWQTDNPNFTGLAAGSGTAYVKDANGCTAQSGYQIEFVGNVLQSGPNQAVGSNDARWNAAFNPIFFTFQREDYEISSVTSGSFGNIRVAINADLTKVQVGDYIYIKTANYDGSYQVTALVDSGHVDLACPRTVNDTIGFANIDRLKPNYYIQLNITYVDPITGKIITTPIVAQPLSNGLCKINLEDFCQSLLQAKDKSDYTLVNYRDMQLSASYQVAYAQIWDGNIVSWTTIDLPFYVIYAASQLQQVGGGNLKEFVPFPLGVHPAKWLCDFENPVYAFGFPFDLGFIFSEYMVGLGAYYKVVLLDINKQPLDSQTVATTFLLNEDHSFILNTDGSKFIIAGQIIPGTTLVEHVGLNRLLINFNPPDDCYYFSVQLLYDVTTPSAVTYPLTEAIICRVDTESCQNPIYLKWIGLTGSWNYFKFGYNQPIGLETSNMVTKKNFVQDWENEDTLEDTISKDAAEKVTVNAENLSISDIIACRGIKTSPKVMEYRNGKWQTVNVAAGSFTEYETMNSQDNFSVTFSRASINLQTQ